MSSMKRIVALPPPRVRLQVVVRARHHAAYSTPLKHNASNRTPVLTSFQPQVTWPTPFLTNSLIQYRLVTGAAFQPESASVIHNATKEMKDVSSDLAKTIAGNRIDPDAKDDPSAVTRETAAGKAHHGNISQDFASITSAIAAEVPKPILYTGLAGTMPYVGTTVSTLYYARSAGLFPEEAAIAIMDASAHIQVTYGAIILSFLGALHWGMEFAAYGGYKGYKRLALGVAPLLAAWPTLAMEPHIALVAQWFAFTGLWYADMRVTEAGWTPRWYSQYRFYLSILVGSCIIFTLTGINYFGPSTRATLDHHLDDLGGSGSASSLMNRNLVDKQKGYGVRTFQLSDRVELAVEDGVANEEDAYVIIKKPKEEEGGEGEASEGTDDSETQGANVE